MIAHNDLVIECLSGAIEESSHLEKARCSL